MGGIRYNMLLSTQSSCAYTTGPTCHHRRPFSDLCASTFSFSSGGLFAARLNSCGWPRLWQSYPQTIALTLFCSDATPQPRLTIVCCFSMAQERALESSTLTSKLFSLARSSLCFAERCSGQAALPFATIPCLTRFHLLPKRLHTSCQANSNAPLKVIIPPPCASYIHPSSLLEAERIPSSQPCHTDYVPLASSLTHLQLRTKTLVLFDS